MRRLFKRIGCQTMSRPAATPARSSSRRFGDDITAGSAGRSFATLAAPSSSTEQASEKRGELDFASVPTVTTSIRRTAVSREAVGEELWEPALARADHLVLPSCANSSAGRAPVHPLFHPWTRISATSESPPLRSIRTSAPAAVATPPPATKMMMTTVESQLREPRGGPDGE